MSDPLMSDPDDHLIVMRHPDLDGESVTVHESAFESHALSGWVKVTESPEAPASDEPMPAKGATKSTSKEDTK